MRVSLIGSIVTCICIGAATFASAQSRIVGDWEGTLKTPARDLRFVLHVTLGDDGAPKATLDSIEQSALGIPVSSITLTGSEVAFGVNAVRGTFAGTLSADGTTMDGVWRQSVEMPLRLKRVTHGEVAPSDLDGTWSGMIEIQNASLRLVLHVTNTPFGLVSSLDSPDQNVKGISATVGRDGNGVTLDLKQIHAGFEGIADPGRTTIEGRWSQGGHNVPLTFTRERNAGAIDPRRPQNPVKPYPYIEENVSYENTSAGITLAGTLTIPRGAGPFPAVVLITGSGAQDRDESMMGHRPFLVLADYLTRHGVAVLRSDDRGVGQSGGNFAAANTLDFATDAEAAVAYLRTRREVDQKKVGLVGHSEGGIIAPLVAGRDPAVAFIVLMAGSGVPGDEIIAEQGVLMLRASGVGAEQVEKTSQRQREILKLVKEEKDPATLDAKLHAALEGMTPAESIPAQIRALTSPGVPLLHFLRSRRRAETRHVSRPRDQRRTRSAGAGRTEPGSHQDGARIVGQPSRHDHAVAGPESSVSDGKDRASH